MARALVLKELRESAAIVAVALLAAVYFFTTLTGVRVTPFQSESRLSSFPFVDDGLTSILVLVGGGLAVTLGLKQTAWESAFDTYGFLLHRPISRARIFGVKLAVGALLTLLIPTLLVAAYAAWASTPGAQDAPFRWSMTYPAWRLCLAMLVVYLGAFASGIRPAWWFGSKLLPLAPAALVVLLFNVVPPWIVTLPLLLLVAALLAATALHHAHHRDY